MGEAKAAFFEPEFNRAIKVRGGDDRLSSDAGAILLREADSRLQLIDSLAHQCYDPRNPDLTRYDFVELLRERLFALALGYESQDDLDRLAHDPAMKIAVWDRRLGSPSGIAVWDRLGERVLEERLASQPTQSRLVGTLAAFRGNRRALRYALGDWVERYVRATGDDCRVRHGTIDIDSFPITTYGDQAGAVYNGYYRETIYHPLVAGFSVGGNYDSGIHGLRMGNGFIHAILREGNAHTAQGLLKFLNQVLRIAPRLAYVYDLRLDAGMTAGSVLDYLTDRNVRFLGRLKSNAVLERMAAEHLKRPGGRPPKEGYEKIIELGQYQAEGWKHPQRVILVVQDFPDPRTGQLYLQPRHFFLVAGFSKQERDAESCLNHYRQRGTFEDRLGEFNQSLGVRLSSPDFLENEATLLLGLLAFNLSNFLRIELEDDLGSCWKLRRFQLSVLKSGGRIVKHARRLWLDISQSVVMFWSLLRDRMASWTLPSRFHLPRGPTCREWRRPPAHAHLSEVLNS